MSNESNVKFVGKNTENSQTSIAEDSKADQAEISADKAYWIKHGSNRSSKAAKSKREIMEEITHERFPWEE